MTRQDAGHPAILKYVYYFIGGLWVFAAAVILLGLIATVIVGTVVGIHALLILTGVIQ